MMSSIKKTKTLPKITASFNLMTGTGVTGPQEPHPVIVEIWTPMDVMSLVIVSTPSDPCIISAFSSSRN